MKFCGYVIANDAEEYLVKSIERVGMSGRVWSRLPDIARRFFSQQSAMKAVRKMDVGYPLYVLELYETATQFRVLTRESKRPSWLTTVAS